MAGDVGKQVNAQVNAQVDELYAQGSAAFRAGRYAETCAFAERAIALEPGLAALHFLLGSARLELRESAQADAAFAICLSLRPKYPMVLYAHARGAAARARAGIALGREPRRLALDRNDRRRVSVVICSITPDKLNTVSAN